MFLPTVSIWRDSNSLNHLITEPYSCGHIRQYYDLKTAFNLPEILTTISVYTISV